MDHLVSIFARRLRPALFALLVVFGLGMSFAPMQAHAAVAGSSAADTDAANATAWSSCNTWSQSRGGGACVWEPYGFGGCGSGGMLNGCACAVNTPWGTSCWTLAGAYIAQLGNPCSSLAPQTIDYAYTSGTPGTSGATWETDPNTGAQVQCPFTISYANSSAIADANGRFHVQATITYSGNPTGSEATATAGNSTYTDSSGNPLAAAPDATPGVTPQICGGGSCYDAATGRYYAVDSAGNQVSVAASAASSSTGGCSSGGGATVCAGSPTAPSPVGQQASTVTDPATQVQSSDKYTASNVSTGAVTGTTVNVFSSTGATKSGASTGSLSSTNKSSSSTTSGNSGPATSSTSSNGDSFNGGGDCNSPPACTGDAVMCGVAQEQWRTMCSAKTATDQLHKDLAGDGTQTAPTGGTHTVAEVSGAKVDTGDTSQLDSSGLGWSQQCPLEDLTVSIGGVTAPITFKPVCDYGAWMRFFVLLLASFGCAGILGGFKIGSIFGGS